VEAHQSPERAAFIRGICEQPEDDLRRLVFADWLTERGEPERGDFIRVQCELAKWRTNKSEGVDGSLSPAGISLHSALRRRERELFDAHTREWFGSPQIIPFLSGESEATLRQYGDHAKSVVRRGFVAEVRCRLAVWVGGECPECDGGSDAYYNTPGEERDSPCSWCRGNGEVPDIGPRVVAEHPVERVVLTDSDLAVYDDTMEVWLLDQSAIPDAVIALLPHKYARWVRTEGLYFEAREHADAALSAALIAWARAQPV
jgi:uncharacterized protein (TIGR02996 family)